MSAALTPAPPRSLGGRRAGSAAPRRLGCALALLALLALFACAPPPTSAPVVVAPPRGTPEPVVTAPPPDEGEPASPRFVLHMVDVGTGLAVLVEGDDFVLVYDAGSNDDRGLGPDNRFLAYLRAVLPSLRRIDHVVLSHPHRDHVELLADVMTAYPVGAAWDAGVVHGICGYRRWLEAVAAAPSTDYHSAAREPGEHVIDFGKSVCGLSARVALRHAERIEEGAEIGLGRRASLRFLHADGQRHGERYNENSLVVRLDLDGTKVLLMGDAEAGERADPSKPPSPRSIEGRLLTERRAELDADVLVLGHHGSKSSSRAAFLQAVSPQVSLLSSGPMQYRGMRLPDDEVVELVERTGGLWRTDRDDVACARNPRKLGRDADGKPGGCDHVQVRIQAGRISADYARVVD